MSEQQTESGRQEPQAGTGEQEAKTFDAEYVDKLRKEAARYRTEAKANAEAARKLNEYEQANATEAEKAAKRIADLEAELSTTRLDSTRRAIAAAHGITDADDIDLFLTGSDEETLTRQAKRLADRTADRMKNGNHVPREGATIPPAKDDNLRQFARELFKADNS